MSGNIACAAVGEDYTRIVTASDVEDSLEEYQTDPIYYECINQIAQEYGVSPFFLLCATEHVYTVENPIIFGVDWSR